MTGEERGHREEVARSTRESGIYLVSKTIPFLCNLLFIKFYTVYFAPEVVGRYETVLALAMIVSSLAIGWLQISLLRFFPKYKGQDRVRELGVGMVVGWIISVALALLVGGILWGLRSSDWGRMLSLDLLPWVALLFLSNSLFVMTTTLLRANRFPIRFSLASTSYSFLNLSFAYLLTLFIGSFLASLVVGTSAALLLPSLVILFSSAKSDQPTASLNKRSQPPDDSSGVAFPTGSPSRVSHPRVASVLAPLLAFGLPLSINQVASQLLNVSDRYLILVLLGEKEAGLYSVVYRIGDFAVRFIILSLMMSAYTAVTETFENKGREAAEKLVASLSRLYLLLAIPLVAGCWMMNREMVQVLAGSEYGESAHLLGWILLGNFFLGLSQYQNFGLHLSHKTMTLAFLTLFAASLNLLLNWIFLPRYGYPVAAYTTCLCFALLSLITPLLSNRHLCWRIPVKSLLRMTLAVVVMSGGVFLLKNLFESNLANLLVPAGVGAVTYTLVLFFLGEIPLYDRLRSRF